MTAPKTADRIVVSVTATDSGDWQVVSVPTGFQGIVSTLFAENDYLAGFVRHEDGEQWEIYDHLDDDDSGLLQVTNISGTITLARPATPFKSSRSDDTRMDAGTGTHTLTLSLGSGTLTRMMRETSPFWKTFSSGDATPSVADYRLFKTNGTTAITRFDDLTNGQRFVVRRGADDIVITHNGSDIDLFGAASITLTAASPAIEFLVDDGVAVQINGFISPLDEDDFASDSAVRPPSQQSAKAYIGLHTFLPPYSTISDLKGVDAAATMANGRRALVLGSASAGDVPAFYVEWSSSSSATADDAGVFRPTTGAASSGNGRWLRVAAAVDVTFTSGDATPSVKNGKWFITAGSTAITMFDDGYQGQEITIQRGGADIVITNDNTKIDCNGVNITLTAAAPRARFVLVGTVWRAVAIGAANYAVGTSGGVIGLLNANKTDSGNNTYSGAANFTGSFKVGMASGSEGGQIDWARAPSGTSTGDPFNDINNDDWRWVTFVSGVTRIVKLPHVSAGTILTTNALGLNGNGSADDGVAIAAAITGGRKHLLLDGISCRIQAGTAATTAVAASGSLYFADQPVNGSTIVMGASGGETVTFTTGSSVTTAGSLAVQIKASLALTLTELASVLNTTTSTKINPATYTATSTKLAILYDTTGTAGNAFVLTPSAGSRAFTFWPTLRYGGWSFVIPANVAIELRNGATLLPDAGVWVYIKGPYTLPNAACFGGSGKVVGMPTVNPVWWGAVLDGSTDDINALDAARDSVMESGSSVGPYMGSVNRPQVAWKGVAAVSRTWRLQPTTYQGINIDGYGTNVGGMRLVPKSTFAGDGLDGQYAALHIAGYGIGSLESIVDVDYRNFMVTDNGNASIGACLYGIQVGSDAVYSQLIGQENNVGANVSVVGAKFLAGIRYVHTRGWTFRDISAWMTGGPVNCLALFVDNLGGSTGDLVVEGGSRLVGPAYTTSGSCCAKVVSPAGIYLIALGTAFNQTSGVKFKSVNFYLAETGLKIDAGQASYLSDIWVGESCQFDNYMDHQIRVTSTWNTGTDVTLVEDIHVSHSYFSHGRTRNMLFESVGTIGGNIRNVWVKDNHQVSSQGVASGEFVRFYGPNLFNVNVNSNIISEPNCAITSGSNAGLGHLMQFGPCKGLSCSDNELRNAGPLTGGSNANKIDVMVYVEASAEDIRVEGNRGSGLPLVAVLKNDAAPSRYRIPGGSRSVGYFNFGANPGNTSTITVGKSGGEVITFTAGASASTPGAVAVNIKATLALTLAELVAQLDACRIAGSTKLAGMKFSAVSPNFWVVGALGEPQSGGTTVTLTAGGGSNGSVTRAMSGGLVDALESNI